MSLAWAIFLHFFGLKAIKIVFAGCCCCKHRHPIVKSQPSSCKWHALFQHTRSKSSNEQSKIQLKSKISFGYLERVTSQIVFTKTLCIRFYLKTKQNFSFCNRVDTRPGRKERTAEHYTIFKSQEGVKLCSLECYTLEIQYSTIHKYVSIYHSLVPEHLRSIVTTTDKAHLEPNLPLACGPRRMNGSFFTFPSKS